MRQGAGGTGATEDQGGKVGTHCLPFHFWWRSEVHLSAVNGLCVLAVFLSHYFFRRLSRFGEINFSFSMFFGSVLLLSPS